MTKQKHIQSAGLVLFCEINGAKKYLLLKHAGNNGSHWDFPKGKVEPSESLEQAALRELEEEAGLQARIVSDKTAQIHYTFTDRADSTVDKTVTFFVAQTDEQTVTLSHEHVAYAWLSYEQALKRLTYDTARSVLKVLAGERGS